MIIVLEEPDEHSDDKGLFLSDDGFDVYGWVTVTVGDYSQDIHIDELHGAVVALYSKYRNKLDVESSL